MTGSLPIGEVCILRLSALGDVTHVLPVIQAIRSQSPDTRITWICGKLEYRLLEHVEGVEFIVFDKRSGIQGLFAIWRQLRSHRFDILLHMHAAARANLLSLGIRADHKVGWDRANARDLHRFFIDDSIEAREHRHQVDAYLDFLPKIGLEKPEPEWGLPQLESRFVDTHLGDQSYVVISPCSSHVMRNWSADRYAAIADHIVETYGIRVVLSGGPSPLERETADAIIAAMQKPVTDLVGKDTLQESICLLARAELLISPDSGPVHIANAVGTRVIGLYACTNPKRSGPYNSIEHCVDHYPEAVQQFLEVSVEDVRWNRKVEQPGVMDLITVADVEVKLRHVLG